MSKQGKIVLGIVTFLPLLFILIYSASFFSTYTSVFHESVHQNGPPGFILSNMNDLQITSALLVITSLGLLIYYVIHVMNNRQLGSTGRLVWVLVILLANVAGYPFYWYMHIWKTAPGNQL